MAAASSSWQVQDMLATRYMQSMHAIWACAQCWQLLLSQQLCMPGRHLVRCWAH